MAETVAVRANVDIVERGRVVVPAGKLIQVIPSRDGMAYYVPTERGNIVKSACFFTPVPPKQ